MDNITLESFITFCDEMQIAEEGFGILRNNIEAANKKISVLKIQFQKANGNRKEELRILKELQSEIKRFRKIIQESDENFFDKSKGYGKSIVGVVGIIASLLAPILTASGLAFGLSIVSASISGGLVVKGNSEMLAGNKKLVLENLDRELLAVNRIISQYQSGIAAESVGYSESKQELKQSTQFYKVNYRLGRKQFKKDKENASNYMNNMEQRVSQNLYKNELAILNTISCKFCNYMNHRFKSNHPKLSFEIDKDSLLTENTYIEIKIKSLQVWDDIEREIPDNPYHIIDQIYNVEKEFKSNNRSYLKTHNVTIRSCEVGDLACAWSITIGLNT